MLNKQGLLGYYKYQQFRDEFHKKQKDASKKQKVRQAKINSNINDGLIALGIVIIIVAAAFGVFYYIRTYWNVRDARFWSGPVGQRSYAAK